MNHFLPKLVKVGTGLLIIAGCVAVGAGRFDLAAAYFVLAFWGLSL